MLRRWRLFAPMLDTVEGLREDQTILHGQVAKPWALAKPNPLMVKHLECYENVTEHPLTELPAFINSVVVSFLDH